MLLGGNGNLTLDAANDIIFNAKTYEIQTQKGFVHLNAGNISAIPTIASASSPAPASPRRAISSLKVTTGDIYLDDVSVKSGGYRIHALFSAQAGGTIDAVGPIDVEAHGTGVGVPSGHAILNLTAGGDARIDDIVLVGSAVGNSPTGRADLSLRANGNIDIAGSLDLLANAISSNGGGRADANALVQAGIGDGSGDVTVAGPLRLAAWGVQRAASGNREIIATADLVIDAGSLHGDVAYGSLAVTANALNNGTHCLCPGARRSGGRPAERRYRGRRDPDPGLGP